MGIFEKNDKKAKIKNSTKGFYFGATEAEGENITGSSLLDYFDDYLEILEQLKIGKFIFTGRKGVGKSAIAKFIKDKSEETDESFAKILRISDFELEKSIQLPLEEENKEKLVFEWLILVNIVKLIVSHECGSYTVEYQKLKKFLDINAGIVNIDKYQIVEGQHNKGGEVNFAVLKHIFGGVFKNYFKVTVDKAPFYKLIPPLKDVLKIILDFPVNKTLEFWLLFDDLDINFNVKKKEDNDKIMELIRISKIYNNEVFKNNKAKILIFIRDDIRDSLVPKYADSAKIFSTYEIIISWYNHRLYNGNNEDEIPLKQLANKRIEINFKKHGISSGKDPWATLFKNENCISNGVKSTFKYVLDFTFYRPRDIITFLSMMSNENYIYPIDKETIKILLKDYIDINVTEIKSELKLFFSDEDIHKIFNALFNFIINEPDLKVDVLKHKISNLNFSLDSDRVFELLTNYSLITFKDESGNLFFNYRDKSALANLDKDKMRITLPKCIYHYYRKIY